MFLTFVGNKLICCLTLAFICISRWWCCWTGPFHGVLSGSQGGDGPVLGPGLWDPEAELPPAPNRSWVFAWPSGSRLSWHSKEEAFHLVALSDAPRSNFNTEQHFIYIWKELEGWGIFGIARLFSCGLLLSCCSIVANVKIEHKACCPALISIQKMSVKNCCRLSSYYE